MIPTLRVVGIREALDLFEGVAARARDSSPAYELVIDDIFDFERSWWQFTYGGREDKEKGRRGRNPELMVETGGLHASATRRGALRQEVHAGPNFAFVGVTDGLAVIHENRGREVLGTPGARTVGTMLERVGTFILTGRATRGTNLWLS